MNGKGTRCSSGNAAAAACLLAIEGVSGETPWSGTRRTTRTQQKRIDTTVFVDVPANGSRQFIVKLPSPIVDAEDAATLAAID